jgi:ribonuclease P protein component
VTSPSARFGRADRLRNSREFLRLQRGGARYQSAHFVFYCGLDRAGEERSRLGITVSRRIGNAMVRNRLKRRVRECYRLKLRAMLPAGAAVVVIARSSAGDLDWATLERELGTGVNGVRRRLSEDRRARGDARD